MRNAVPRFFTGEKPALGAAEGMFCVLGRMRHAWAPFPVFQGLVGHRLYLYDTHARNRLKYTHVVMEMRTS